MRKRGREGEGERGREGEQSRLSVSVVQSSAVTYHLFALNLSLSRILRSSEVTLQERERGENGGG